MKSAGKEVKIVTIYQEKITWLEENLTSLKVNPDKIKEIFNNL